MTTLEICQYYANLLILQYRGKEKAHATVQTTVTPIVMPQISVQTLSFSAVPHSGSFVLSYNDQLSVAINWNDNAATIQSKIQAIPWLSSVTTTGEVVSQLVTVTFTGITPPALSLVEVFNSLKTAGNADVKITITETDEILPLAVQNAFNLIGDNTAVGDQLDILGKYAGVTRSGFAEGRPITLNDSDFFILIQFAILRNTAGSSLADIQNLIHQFFPDNEILVFDYKTMRMSYLIDSDLGSIDLILLLISEGLLPKPMAVGLSVIYTPVITQFFAFRTTQQASYFGRPFNTTLDYHTDWPWLSVADGIPV